MKAKITKVISWVASLALVISALVVSRIVLFPVDVLTDWTISIPDDHFSLGDKTTIDTRYTKNADAAGVSTRYLECLSKRGTYVRYELNESSADRAPGKGTNGIPVSIPSDLVGVDIPTKCYFSVSIHYDLFPLRTYPEYARTGDFTLTARKDPEPQVIEPSRSPDPSIANPSVSPVPRVTPNPSVQSIPQTHQVATPTEPAARPLDPVPQPGFLETTIDGVVEGVDNVLNAVTSLLFRR